MIAGQTVEQTVRRSNSGLILNFGRHVVVGQMTARLNGQSIQQIGAGVAVAYRLQTVAVNQTVVVHAVRAQIVQVVGGAVVARTVVQTVVQAVATQMNVHRQ